MIPKQFDDIEKSDIDALLENKVAEGRTLEYKRILQLRPDKEKKEFLADISAFANASGGDILFGVDEDTEGGRAIPKEIKGLEEFREDHILQQIDQVILTNIAPRITYRTKVISGFELGPVLLIRVWQSWNRPHMVTHGGGSRFFSRTSAVKYQLDVDELRSAFALSESLSERIRNFRDGRIAAIIGEETPVPLASYPKLVLHLASVQAFGSGDRVLLSSPRSDEASLIQPLYSYGEIRRFNFDGFLSYSTNNGIASTYAQLNRDASMELVNAGMIRDSSGVKNVPSEAIYKEVVEAIKRYLALLKRFDVGLPVIVMLSMLEVKGYMVVAKPPTWHDEPPFPIDKDVLVFPDIMINESEDDLEQLLVPVFDAMYQSSGWNGRPRN